MFNHSCFKLLFVGAVGSLLAGCGSTREVDVEGEVSAPTGVQVEGPIVLDFSDILDESEEPKSVHQATLAAPGEFSEKVELEGDKLLVRAIDDRDGDGACSAGEPWAEVEAAIADDDTVEPVTLALSNAACPSAE